MFEITQKSTVDEAIDFVSSQMSAQGAAIAPEGAANVVVAGMESLGDIAAQQGFADQMQTLSGSLRSDDGFMKVLKAEYGEDEVAITAGIEAAVATIYAAQDPAKFAQGFMKPQQGQNVLGRDFNAETMVAGMEGYDQNAFADFAAASVVFNALNASGDAFAEAFFRTKMIPAGKSGIDVEVKVPKVYNRTVRGNTGAPTDINKKSLVAAVRDASILANDSTKIVPVSKAENDAYLVPAAQVAAFKETINGTEVDTRPIAMGKKVDLLALSAHPGIILGEQDETDTIDPNLAVGDLYINISNPSANSAVGVDMTFKLSTAGMQGSLFTRPAEGDSSDLTVNFTGQLQVRKNTKDITGASIAALELADDVSAGAAADWAMTFEVKVSGDANTTTGSFELNAVKATVTGFVGGDDGMTPIADITGLDDVVITILGTMPAARRSNSNMRSRGLSVESGSTVTYRLPVELQSPISTISPVSGDHYGVTIEALNATNRIRNANRAVDTLLEMEAALAANSGLAGTSAFAGSTLVTPTYASETVDVAAQVISARSSGSYDDLREAILNSVTAIVHRMVLESGYTAALKTVPGSREYEVVIGTDEQIASLLMKSGDARTLGNGISFRVAATDDQRLRGQIKIALRRKGADAADPLNFGIHGVTTSLIFRAATSKGSATSNEIQLQPRNRHHVLCPVLGAITVTGLESLFLTATPKVS